MPHSIAKYEHNDSGPHGLGSLPSVVLWCVAAGWIGLAVGCGAGDGSSSEAASPTEQAASPSASAADDSLDPLGSTEAQIGTRAIDDGANAEVAAPLEESTGSTTTEAPDPDMTTTADEGGQADSSAPESLAVTTVLQALASWPYGPVTGVPPEYSEDLVSSVVGLSGQAAIDDMLMDGVFLYSLGAALSNTFCSETGVVDEVAGGVIVDCSAQYHDAVMAAFGVEPEWISSRYSVKENQIIRILTFNDAPLVFESYLQTYIQNEGAAAHTAGCGEDRRSRPCAQALIELATQAAPGWQP